MRRSDATPTGRGEPSELQKLYGSNLPPSLRWGALREQNKAQEDGTSRTPRETVVRRTIDRPPKRASPRRRNTKDQKADPFVFEQERRPYFHKSSTSTPRPPLQLRNEPEYSEYPGAESQWTDRRDAASRSEIADRERKLRVIDQFRKHQRLSRDEKAWKVAKNWYNRSAIAERRKNQPTVEDAKKDEAGQGQTPQATTERRDEGSPVPRPPSHTEAGSQDRRESVEERGSKDTDNLNFIARFEAELRRRLSLWGYSERVIQRWVKGDGAELRWKYPATADDDRPFQQKFLAEMRRRLEFLGFKPDDVDRLTDEEQMNKYASEQNRRPTFPKIHRDHIELETLKYYDIPWEFDRNDDRYIIILDEMDERQTDILFKHTAMLRQSALSREQEDKADDTDEEPKSSRYDEVASTLVLIEDWTQKKDKAQWRIGHAIPDLIDGSNPEYTRRKSAWFRQDSNDLLDQPPTSGRRQSALVPSPSMVVREDLEHDLLMLLSPSTTTGRPSQSGGQVMIDPPVPKRVIHATYGGVLKHGSNAEFSTTGFVTAPWSPRSEQLFHLSHIQQDELNYDDFKGQVLSLWGQSAGRDAIEDHLNRVQKLHEKDAKTGHSVRHMEPFVEMSEKDGQTGIGLLSACIPFPHVTRHRHKVNARLDITNAIWGILRRSHRHQNHEPRASSGPPGSAYPERTLFQSLNPRLNSRRDLQQVVCHMLEPEDHRYMCVSQVWCLIVNEGLIITCSVLSEKDLYGDLERAPGIFDEEPPMHRAGFLLVSTPDERAWILKRSECLTYLDFVSHFSDITSHFLDDFFVEVDGEEIEPHQWSASIRHATRSLLRVVLKHRSVSPSKHGIRYGETPVARSLHNSLAHKMFPRAEQVMLGRDRDGNQSWIEIGEKDRRHSTVKDAHEDRSTEKLPGDDDGRDHSGGKGPNQDGSGDHNKTDESNDNGDMKVNVSTDILGEKKLRELNLEFEAGGYENTFALPYNRETEEAIANAMSLGTEDLFKITFDNLSVALDGTDEIDISRLAAVNIPGTRELGGKGAAVLDEAELYDDCGSMTNNNYQRELQAWYRTMSTREKDRSAENDRVSIREVNAFSAALGVPTNMHAFGQTQDISAMPLDGFNLGSLQSGFRHLLDLFLSPALNDALQSQQGKLRAAMFGLVTTIHKLLRPSTMKLGIFVLRMVALRFRRVFHVVQEIEAYLISLPLMLEVGKTPISDINDAIRHITTAMLLAIRSIAELEYELPMIEDEVLKQGETIIELRVSDSDPFGFDTAREYGKALHDATEDAGPGASMRHEVLQRKFDEGLSQLRARGWDPRFARAILRNEYRWSRVQYHDTCASRLLRAAFRATLTAKVEKKIEWKAAAYPTDLLLLLLPQLLWRPLSKPDLGDNNAVDMYNQYITELESTILIGDSSREPLERIRHLRYELNAFSQLQNDHLTLLSQLSTALSARDPLPPPPPPSEHDPDTPDPHPRRALLAALIRGTRLQNTNVRQLHAALDDLSSEAQARVLGAQDWRDNAVVVFTIVTVVFLPLGFVASVFGMNTNDVRNMSVDQWAFWAAAAPFTALVILVTLWFVDVPPLWRWIDRKNRGGEEGREYRLPKTKGAQGRFLVDLAREEAGEKERDRDRVVVKEEHVTGLESV